MKHYTCDICGAEIPLEDRLREESTLRIMKIMGVAADICPRCRLVGEALDPNAILLNAWKSQVKRAG